MSEVRGQSHLLLCGQMILVLYMLILVLDFIGLVSASDICHKSWWIIWYLPPFLVTTLFFLLCHRCLFLLSGWVHELISLLISSYVQVWLVAFLSLVFLYQFQIVSMFCWWSFVSILPSVGVSFAVPGRWSFRNRVPYSWLICWLGVLRGIHERASALAFVLPGWCTIVTS